MLKPLVQQTPQGWRFLIVDGGPVFHRDSRVFPQSHLATQAGFQWIKEWMHERVCNRNAVELP